MILALFLFSFMIGAPELQAGAANQDTSAVSTTSDASNSIERGKQIFRFDTFGDEIFWGDALQLHKAIAGERLGGVGEGLSPKKALSLGLKVDATALPSSVTDAIKGATVDLNDPAVTLQLLQAKAVVGVSGFFDASGSLASIGIQCALCHSTVDDSLAPGMGNRLDGWANRDLDIGKIIALSPNLQPLADFIGVDVATAQAVLNSWGPGKFDALLVLDRKAVNPITGSSGATLIPPAFGLAGVNLHTWTGWGSVPYWNAFVAVLEMHGQGTFIDLRLSNPANSDKWPNAVEKNLGNVRPTGEDLVTPKLGALHLYQLSLSAPPAPAGSFDRAAAEHGKEVFNAKGRCAECHVPPLYTDPGWNMHSPESVGLDDFQANRSPVRAYRTSPLKGLWTHMKGGFFHDGRIKTLPELVDAFNSLLKLNLTDQEKSDLVEFLKSL